MPGRDQQLPLADQRPHLERQLPGAPANSQYRQERIVRGRQVSLLQAEASLNGHRRLQIGECKPAQRAAPSVETDASISINPLRCCLRSCDDCAPAQAHHRAGAAPAPHLLPAEWRWHTELSLAPEALSGNCG